MIQKEFNFNDPKMLRQKAEKKLKENKADKNAPAEEADIKKLLHELQVHQIELEMQNEELQLAYETAEEALKKHTLLYDLAPISFFVVDDKSSIKELNFTAAEMLGEPRFSLLNNHFRLFIMDDSLAVFNLFFDRIYTSFAKEYCQIKLGYGQHLLCTVYLEGMVTGEDKRCLLSVVDISKFSEPQL